jgi:predicted RNase H-like HicB family nuclease
LNILTKPWPSPSIVPDLKGCSAFRETPQEAFQEIQVAVDLWLDVARRDSKAVPETSLMTA